MSAAPKSRPDSRHALSAVDQVIVAIKEGIRVGRFAPGQRLGEPELIRTLNVSRGSVREALRLLASEGLVEQRPFSGVRVRKMTRKEVMELSQIRELLEGLAAGLAAQRIDAAGKKRFAALEKGFDEKSRPRFGSYSGYNQRFHDFIMQTSAHPHLPMFLERTQLEILRLQFVRVLESGAAVARSRAEHREIFSAILKGDARTAERAMQRHVRGSTNLILKAPDDFFQL